MNLLLLTDSIVPTIDFNSRNYYFWENTIFLADATYSFLFYFICLYPRYDTFPWSFQGLMRCHIKSMFQFHNIKLLASYYRPVFHVCTPPYHFQCYKFLKFIADTMQMRQFRFAKQATRETLFSHSIGRLKYHVCLRFEKCLTVNVLLWNTSSFDKKLTLPFHHPKPVKPYCLNGTALLSQDGAFIMRD